MFAAVRALVCVWFSFASIILYGTWTDIKSNEFKLEPFPKKGTAAYERDYELLVKAQEQRTDDDCSHPSSDRYASFKSLYDSSEIFSEKELSSLSEFMERAGDFAERVAGYHKRKFKRKRPYDVDTRIEPCVERPG